MPFVCAFRNNRPTLFLFPFRLYFSASAAQSCHRAENDKLGKVLQEICQVYFPCSVVSSEIILVQIMFAYRFAEIHPTFYFPDKVVSLFSGHLHDKRETVLSVFSFLQGFHLLRSKIDVSY